MKLSTVATITGAASVFAWDTTTTPPTGSCLIITATEGSGCTLPTPCTRPMCLMLATATQSCGCPNPVPTLTQCATTCDGKCPTSTQVVYIPCTTSAPSSSITTSSESVSTSSSNSSTSLLSSTSGFYPNSTVTVTSITTISTCPVRKTCHGQTTTWTGTEGPFPCSSKPICTCVLPGGGSTTITGPTETSSPLKTGPTATPTSSPTIVPAGAGNRVLPGGWIAAILGLGMALI